MHRDVTFTKERLDQAIINQSWGKVFGIQGVEVMSTRRSDHLPLLLTSKTERNNKDKKSNVFRFESKWSCMEGSNQVIKQAWYNHNWELDNLKNLQKRLNNYRVKITIWSTKHRRYVNKEIEEKTTQLREIQRREGPRESELIRQLDKELDLLLELEDQKWK